MIARHSITNMGFQCHACDDDYCQAAQNYQECSENCISESEEGWKAGQIAGVVVGCFLGIVFLIFLFFTRTILKRCRGSKGRSYEHEVDVDDDDDEDKERTYEYDIVFDEYNQLKVSI